jgi:hypothetical protein
MLIRSIGLSVLRVNILRLRYEPNRLMLSMDLQRWYISVIITILDIIHLLVFYLKHDVSDTAFWFRPQVEPTLLGPIDRAGAVRRQILAL